MKKSGIFVDPVTGEYFQVIPVGDKGKTRKHQRSFFMDWFFVNTEALEPLERCKSVTDIRVFWAFLARLKYGNTVQLNQAELAAELKMKPSMVSTAIKHMTANDWVRPTPARGVCKTYMVNPHMVWRGTSAKHQIAVALWAIKQFPGHEKKQERVA